MLNAQTIKNTRLIFFFAFDELFYFLPDHGFYAILLLLSFERKTKCNINFA